MSRGGKVDRAHVKLGEIVESAKVSAKPGELKITIGYYGSKTRRLQAMVDSMQRLNPEATIELIDLKNAPRKGAR